MRMIVITCGLAMLGSLGCAAAPASETCVEGLSYTVSPAAATADHSAANPGNQQKFTGTSAPFSVSGSCPLPQYVKITNADWKSSDPLNVAVSSAKDATNGLATCTGATSGPVTLTATSSDSTTPATATVQLTCK